MKKIILFMALVLFTGCSSYTVGPVTGVDAGSNISFSDVDLLYVNVVSETRNRDGQKIVQVQGMSDETQTIYYKTEWYDANGMKISTSLTQWKRANIIENVEFAWSMVAPSKKASSYKIYIFKNIGDGLIK